MLGVIIIILLCAAFYVFIGYGPEEAVKIMLTVMWGLIILSIPISLIAAMLR